MQINNSLSSWMKNAKDDPDLTIELQKIKDNEQELYERFYKNLEFGTAGLRGLLGVGPNRMNIYTVRLATQGLVNYIKKSHEEGSVAISYDSRNKSTLFAHEAACVLAANGLKVYLTKELSPTPVLSFAVRHFKCNAGIMITASHNPAEYNGYKCYGPDGCQMTDDSAAQVLQEIKKLDTFNDVKTSDFECLKRSGAIEFIEDEFYDAYLEQVDRQRINRDIFNNNELRVVYTPLNGAGNKLVREMLKRTGVNDVTVVKEQELPDGNFPTCKYPNPEFKDTLKLAIETAQKTDSEIVLATDPDCDRVGVAVKKNDDYRLLTGNEIGILLTNYILSQRKVNKTLCEKPVIVRTIVSSPLVDLIAEEYDCEVRTVLTGFKYIGEQILRLEQKNEEDRFVFGFEESYGYLAGTYVRDKDAVVASTLICEMIAYYKNQGKTVIDVLNELYEKFGVYESRTVSLSYESNNAGMNKIKSIMQNFREKPLKEIASLKVLRCEDYLASNSELNLPKSNVLSYILENKNQVIIRPSGTEPKIKIYVTATAGSAQSVTKLSEKIIGDIISYIKKSI